MELSQMPEPSESSSTYIINNSFRTSQPPPSPITYSSRPSSSFKHLNLTPKLKISCMQMIRNVFLQTKLNILLFFVPLSFISNYGDWGDDATFMFSILGLIPL